MCYFSVFRALTRAIVFRLKMSSSLEYPRYENKYRIARMYALACALRRRERQRHGNYRTRRALYAIMIRSSMKPSNGHSIALHVGQSGRHLSSEEKTKKETKKEVERVRCHQMRTYGATLVHRDQLRSRGEGFRLDIWSQPIPIGNATKHARRAVTYHRH